MTDAEATKLAQELLDVLNRRKVGAVDAVAIATHALISIASGLGLSAEAVCGAVRVGYEEIRMARAS